MKKIACLIAMMSLLMLHGITQPAPGRYHLKLAKLKYSGGGDWYANPSSLPNLIRHINENSTLRVAPAEEVVEPGSPQIFQYPYVYMTGHGNITLSSAEAENLRNYLLAGGFLHIDDNYGLDKYVRKEMKKVFPELEFVELPFTHPIYHAFYDFPAGLPKVHEHDNKPPQGLALMWEDRVICFYSYECDLGDGWEDPQVHNDPEPVRQQALRMGLNIVIWALNN
ncbi:MAG: DUF4159 domain-containing protein [Bacteroidia bacterium]|nr:DUF4159 domain-containing protein [Bacteroidia bacterium]